MIRFLVYNILKFKNKNAIMVVTGGLKNITKVKIYNPPSQYMTCLEHNILICSLKVSCHISLMKNVIYNLSLSNFIINQDQN